MSALVVIDLPLLAKVCGLFGSDFDGERAAAAAKADRLVRDAGLTWSDLLHDGNLPAPGGSETTRRRVDLSPGSILANHGHLLTDWETTFLATLARRGPPWSPRQNDVLGEIRARCAGETG